MALCVKLRVSRRSQKGITEGSPVDWTIHLARYVEGEKFGTYLEEVQRIHQDTGNEDVGVLRNTLRCNIGQLACSGGRSTQPRLY